MALSDREKIIIANTITGYISNISVTSPEGFLPLIRTLRSLVTSGPETNTESAYDSSLITDYMDPDFAAVAPENRPEFINLCKEIILKRIEYFEHLSDSEKVNYINAQTSYKQEVKVNQATLSNATPPIEGSEAHVSSVSSSSSILVERLALLGLHVVRFGRVQASRNNYDRIEGAEAHVDPAPSNLEGLDSEREAFETEALENAYRSLRLFPFNIWRGTFFPPPPRQELLNFGNWTRTADTWEQGYDSTPWNTTPHLNRQREYTNSNINVIKSISILGYTDGSLHLTCWSSFDLTDMQQFAASLNNNGINQSTPGVESFPDLFPLLRIIITPDNINEILDKVFKSIAALEGENSINEAMKTEITQSLQQFVPARPGF